MFSIDRRDSNLKVDDIGAIVLRTSQAANGLFGNKDWNARGIVVEDLLSADYARADAIFNNITDGIASEYVLNKSEKKIVAKKYDSQSKKKRDDWGKYSNTKRHDRDDVREWDEAGIELFFQQREMVCEITGIDLTDDAECDGYLFLM